MNYLPEIFVSVLIVLVLAWLMWSKRAVNQQSEQMNDDATTKVNPNSHGSDTINTKVLERLAQDISITEFPHLIDVFLTELDSRGHSVVTALAEDNENNLRIQVHSIKSCARTFGATALAQIAEVIEQDIINKQITKAISEIPIMLDLLPGIRLAFTDYRDNIKAGF